jgi:phage tail protein X|tara:strand:- start:198 stop:506 length:309 start_codon:yes stop_codon:yes gene_type:complete
MNRYRNTKTRQDRNKQKYYKSVIYPTPPESLDDIYVETEYGDRVDILAFQFYKDPSLWWIITSANPNKLRRDSYVCPPGLQIRIPLNPAPIIQEFESLNASR